MYIHRVGRTARYTAGGRALLTLLPTEEKRVVENLKKVGVPISKLTVNPKYTISVASSAAALLVSHPECRLLAKKAFTSYLRSLQMLGSSDSVDIKNLPVDEFASSLGLAFTPEVPTIAKGDEGRLEVREKKNVNRSLDKLKKQIKEAKELKRKLREERLSGENQDFSPLASGGNKLTSVSEKKVKANKQNKRISGEIDIVGDEDDGDELFVVKEVRDWGVGDIDRKSTRLNSSHLKLSRMPSSA